MTAPKCPVCRKPVDPAYRPFCSRRCADVDLQRWLTGRYAIAGDAEDDTEGDAGEGGNA
jgi:endogenous inhibitor of DNA gyrase (YacG/DUF329 family)